MSDITLRDYIDIRISSVENSIESLQEYIQQHFELNEKAVKLANESMLTRLETMNEFRAQILEERANLATKDDLCNVYDKIDARLCPLEESKAFSSGKMWVVMAIFAAVPTVLALIAIFII